MLCITCIVGCLSFLCSRIFPYPHPPGVGFYTYIICIAVKSSMPVPPGLLQSAFLPPAAAHEEEQGRGASPTTPLLFIGGRVGNTVTTFTKPWPDPVGTFLLLHGNEHSN